MSKQIEVEGTLTKKDGTPISTEEFDVFYHNFIELIESEELDFLGVFNPKDE